MMLFPSYMWQFYIHIYHLMQYLLRLRSLFSVHYFSYVHYLSSHESVFELTSLSL